ncbi:hypothetical protein [Rhodococcoides yunnanense]|uniref:hypothetical protein n=1 Tax=Rhodococcoides yunnanense TaxID=278209 RepID=UPI001FE519BE|nr:hypothetical protein [Rhodococcus yunnanensis]
MRVQLLRVAALIGLLFLAGFLLPKLGPEAPGAYEGVVAAPTSPRLTGAPTPTTTVPGPPPGFPSMEYAPPEIEVPDGDPIPIDTKYGISYTVPGDWRNDSRAVAGWGGSGGSVTYGAIAIYGYDYCPEHHDGARKAMSGMTGRNGVDVATAAFEASRQAEIIFRDQPDDAVRIDYSGPVEFEIDGAPSVRYSVRASNIAQKFDCDPTEATFDVVATQGYSNATVAVFIVQTDQRIQGALARSVVDQVISTLRRKN